MLFVSNFRLIPLVLAFFITGGTFHSCNAQPINDKEDLLGSWTLNKKKTDEDGVIFELNKPEKSIQHSFKVVREMLAELSPGDSLRVRQKAIENYIMTSKTRYIFTEDSVYLYATDYDTTKVITIPGTYVFNKNAQTVTCNMDWSAAYKKPGVHMPTVFIIKGDKLVIRKEYEDKKDFNYTEEYVKSKANVQNEAQIFTSSRDGIKQETQKVPRILPEVEHVYNQVKEMPQFHGGATKLNEYLLKHIRYPQDAADAGIEGRVVVRFIIKADGNIDRNNIEVRQKLFPSLDTEAVRVIKSMPAWKPGKQNGKAVATFYTIPIMFYLRGE